LGPKPKKVCPAVNGGLSNYTKGDYDTEYWLCKPAGKCGRFINMKDLDHGGEYTVSIARVKKALRFLHLPTVAASLRSCAGYQRATTHSVLTHRHTYFQQLDETARPSFWRIRYGLTISAPPAGRRAHDNDSNG
jgi:hypothetical protein